MLQAPKLPAQFSLFRQRPLKGFGYTPRYYDPMAEERQERMARLREQAGQGATGDREALRQRLRHSWQREGSNRSSAMRLAVLLGLFAALAYAAYRMLSLTANS
jgi:hypothetical protein